MDVSYEDRAVVERKENMLFQYIEQGNVVGLKNLLQETTVDVNALSKDVSSALHCAVKHGQLVCLDLLLRQVRGDM
jgi:ankyrin repeat protein